MPWPGMSLRRYAARQASECDHRGTGALDVVRKVRRTQNGICRRDVDRSGLTAPRFTRRARGGAGVDRDATHRRLRSRLDGLSVLHQKSRYATYAAISADAFACQEPPRSNPRPDERSSKGGPRAPQPRFVSSGATCAAPHRQRMSSTWRCGARLRRHIAPEPGPRSSAID